MIYQDKKQNKIYKTLFNSNLLIVELEPNRILFTLFNFNHQEILYQTQFLLIHLQNILSNPDSPKTLLQLFTHIKINPQQILSFSEHFLTLKIKLQEENQSSLIEIPLLRNKLEPTQSIKYIKQFSNAKEEKYKSEILGLKSKIYELMTKIDYATSLITSQAIQTKSYKVKIKSLKEQLKQMENKKKKQQETSMVEVAIQHCFSTQVDDIIQCLNRIQMKHFNVDQQLMKNLTIFIEQEIKQKQQMFLIQNEALKKKDSIIQNFSCERKTNRSQERNSQQVQKSSKSPKKLSCFSEIPVGLKLENYQVKNLELV